MYDCDFKNSKGRCTKYDYPRECKPSTIDWCDEEVEMIEAYKMCMCRSIFGNTYSFITEDQIEDLKAGKVVYINDGEYCHFIACKSPSTEGRMDDKIEDEMEEPNRVFEDLFNIFRLKSYTVNEFNFTDSNRRLVGDFESRYPKMYERVRSFKYATETPNILYMILNNDDEMYYDFDTKLVRVLYPSDDENKEK